MTSRTIVDKRGNVWRVSDYDGDLRVTLWAGPGAHLALEVTIPRELVAQTLEDS